MACLDNPSCVHPFAGWQRLRLWNVAECTQEGAARPAQVKVCRGRHADCRSGIGAHPSKPPLTPTHTHANWMPTSAVLALRRITRLCHALQRPRPGDRFRRPCSWQLAAYPQRVRHGQRLLLRSACGCRRCGVRSRRKRRACASVLTPKMRRRGLGCPFRPPAGSPACRNWARDAPCRKGQQACSRGLRLAPWWY